MAANKPRRVFNPGDQPVVIDSAGHVLAGGEWADLDPGRHTAAQLLDRHRLLFPDEHKHHPHQPKTSAHAADQTQE